MKLHRYTTVQEFRVQTEPLLLQNEAENNLILGLSSTMTDSPKPVNGPWLFAIEDGGQIMAAALMADPRFGIVLTRGFACGASLLTDALWQEKSPLAKVNGPTDDSQAFAKLWASGSGVQIQPGMGLGIYALQRVISPSGHCGKLRVAAQADKRTLIEWMDNFVLEALGHPATNPEKSVDAGIAKNSIFVWDIGEIVSMAACTGPTPNGIRINQVFTPRRLRGRGYASACVAALSQSLLDSGRKFCFLFTDLSNPTSNSIYRKIGYEHVCDFQEYRFASTT